MVIKDSFIPHLYDQTYVDRVDSFWLVYNPFAVGGLAVINKEAKFFLDLIDGKRSIKEIFQQSKIEDKTLSISQVVRTFNNFLKSGIIYFDTPKTHEEIFTKKPKFLSVWLHITNQCNLRCKYCYVWKNQERMSEGIARKAIANIVRDVAKHEFKRISFKFSGGECLLEFDHVLKLVKFAREETKKKKIKADFIVLTNGVLLTEKTAKILKDKNFEVSISLDGFGKYHDATRVFPSGKGSFKFVIKGINNLLKYKIPFNVSVTVNSRNIENMPELTKYFLKNNIPFAFNFYRENPFVSEKLNNDDQKMIKYLKKSYELIGKNPPKYSLMNGILDRVTFKKPHLHACGMGLNYIVVGHKGTLHSCQMTLQKPIGTIDDPDLIETMRKGSFVRPRGLNVDGKTPCQTCQWRYVCCGGCPLLTFTHKKNYRTNSPYCEVYKALIPEVLKLEAKRLIKWGIK